MFLTLIATLCLADACTDKVVTTEATPLECAGSTAAQRIPQWMTDNGYLARGYRLQRYGCVRPGHERTPA